MILEYARDISAAFESYKADAEKPGSLIDRILHFVWIPEGDSPIKGRWNLLFDKRYYLLKSRR